MWVGLVFVACLGGPAAPAIQQVAGDTAAATECREHEVFFNGSMMECLMFGQQRIVQWQDENEPWSLEGGYRCKMGQPT